MTTHTTPTPTTASGAVAEVRTPATAASPGPSTAPSAGPSQLEAARSIVLLAARFLVGLSAGFFVTYEASVTLGLAQVDDATYVETFQAINATIRNPVFAVVFFGPIPVLALALAAYRRRGTATQVLLASALALYLLCVGITFGGNVPLNEELADRGSDLTAAEAGEARAEFEDEWNRLNLLRTIAVTASFGAVLATSSGRRRELTTSDEQTA